MLKSDVKQLIESTKEKGQDRVLAEDAVFYINFLEGMLEHFSDEDFEKNGLETLAQRMMAGEEGKVIVELKRGVQNGDIGLVIKSEGVFPEELFEIAEALQRRAVEILQKEGRFKPCPECECEGHFAPPIDERKDVV